MKAKEMLIRISAAGMSLAGVVCGALLVALLYFWLERPPVSETLSAFQESAAWTLGGLFITGLLAGLIKGMIGVVRQQHLTNNILAIVLSLLVVLGVVLPTLFGRVT
jgi:uncharacterized membrane protein